LSEAFEGVQAAKADGCFVVTQLFDGFGVELGDAAFGGVKVGVLCGDFLVVLTAEASISPTAAPAPPPAASPVRTASSWALARLVPAAA
jgi:hypothetical protein